MANERILHRMSRNSAFLGRIGILLSTAFFIFPVASRADFSSLQTATVNAFISFSTNPIQINPLCTSTTPSSKILPPVLSVNPIGSVSGASPELQLSGVASADGCVQQISLLYKKTFDSNVSVMSYTLPADIHSTTFTFTVPPEIVTSEGVMLQVRTVDMSSNTISWPTTSYAQVDVSGFAQVTLGPTGGTLLVPNSFERSAGTGLNFPPGALKGETTITARELDPLSVPNSNCTNYHGQVPVTVFAFEPSGTVFNRPVTMNLLYPDRNRDGVIDGTDKEQKLAQIFLCTDTGWQPLGGTVNMDTKIVTTRVLHFSIYAVIPTIPLLPEDYRPMQRIITPGRADGQNDQAVFGFMGPDMRIDIFDSTGNRVRTLQNTTIWDGRNDEGKIVESGIYIYQYVKDGKRISGAIAVAK